MNVSLMTIFKLLFLAVLVLFFGWFLLFGILRCRRLKQQAFESTNKDKDTYIRKFKRTLIVMVIFPLCVVCVSGPALATSINEVLENRTAISEPPPYGPIPQPADPEPTFPISPPITKEEDIPPSSFSISPSTAKEEDIPLPFQLSAVENSLMLTLDKQLIGSTEIDVEQLASAADGRLDRYIAQCCQSDLSFPFYQNLADYFPSGESINHSFDSVGSLEECNAQLRGAGERLKHRRANGSLEQMGEIYYQLAIRSRDALNFTKYQAVEGQKDRLIWLYSEISFAALINEYIYTQPVGLTLSNWYYRMAQVFDYLGGIADTKELELRMYFLSAVFLRSSFETLKEQGLQVYPDAYDYEIWTLYAKLLYRVAVRVAPAQAVGFYLEIQTVEAAVFQQALPDKIITQTTKTLNDLALYQQWRGRYD